MRSYSTAFGNYYPLGNNTTKILCQVYNSTGATTTELTSYLGNDWVRQVQVSDSIDDPGLTGKIYLQRDQYRLSFSPLVTASRMNSTEALVYPGRRLVLQTATVPVDTTPLASDYLTLADMHIDTLDFSKDVMELGCSDRIVALLRNCYIDTQRVYGSGYVAVETVMQGILDDNLNTPLGYTVANNKYIALQLPGGSPGYVIAAPTVQKQSVLDALNTLANANGWALRVRYLPSASPAGFYLCFYAPPRTSGTSVYTLKPSMYDDITQAQVSKTDIRNYIFGSYTDSTSLVRQQVVVQDATSIAKYGAPPMKMEITEAATSQINTSAQMTTLLGNALSDLKDPLFVYAISMPYFGPVEVGDIMTLAANSVTHDVAQNAGVQQLSHSIGRNQLQTQLTVRGAPAGLYKRWFVGEARPGVGPSSNNIDPAAPTVSAVLGIGTLTINYTVSDQNNWASTEIYLSSANAASSPFSQASVNGKKARPAGGTLVAKGKLAHFTVNGLIPGATYYVVAVVIDRDGNVGTMSSAINAATQTVGPYHENVSGQQDQLVRNPDLNVYTLGSGTPPDQWTLDGRQLASPYTNVDLWSTSYQTTGTSGKYAVYLDGSAAYDVRTNCYYISTYMSAIYNTTVFPSGATATYGHVFYSAPMAFAGGDPITAVVYAKSSAAGTSTGIRFVFFIMPCDANGTPLGTPTYSLFYPTTTLAGYYIAPVATSASAKMISIGVVAITPGSGTTTSLVIDRFYCNRPVIQMSGAIYADSSSQGNSALIICVPADPTGLFRTSNLNSTAGGYTDTYTTVAGTYQLTCSVPIKVTAASSGSQIFLQINVAGTAAATSKITPTVVGSYTITATISVYMQVNTNIELIVNNPGTTTTWSVPTTSGVFSFSQITRADR